MVWIYFWQGGAGVGGIRWELGMERSCYSFWEKPRALCHRGKWFPNARELWQAGLPLSSIPGPAYLAMLPRTSICLSLDRSGIPCPIPKRLELRILELTLERDRGLPKATQQARYSTLGLHNWLRSLQLFLALGLSTVEVAGSHLSTEVPKLVVLLSVASVTVVIHGLKI